MTIITALAKEIMFSGVLVCLSVCCKQHFSKGFKWSAMKIYGGIQGDTMKN